MDRLEDTLNEHTDKPLEDVLRDFCSCEKNTDIENARQLYRALAKFGSVKRTTK